MDKKGKIVKEENKPNEDITPTDWLIGLAIAIVFAAIAIFFFFLDWAPST